MIDALCRQPEVPLLLCLARTHPDAACRARVERLLQQQGVDWTALLDLAGTHGVLPLLHQNLKEMRSERVPQQVSALLRQAYYGTVAENLLQAKELGRVYGLLGAHGVPVIAFKGPVLAQLAYDSLGLRRSGDLDLFIPERAFPEAQAVLLEEGYKYFRQIQRLSKLGRAVKRRISRQVPFLRSDPRVYLDLHIGIMPPGYSYSERFEDLYARSRVVTVAEAEVRSFSPEDLLLILCFHGVKNRWEFLKYGCDVAELIRAHPALDWEAVRERARRMRAERVLHIGLLVAHTFFDTALPPAMLHAVEQDTAARTTLGRVASDLASRRAEPLTYAERFRFNLLIQDTLLNKVRYLLYATIRRFSLDAV